MIKLIKSTFYKEAETKQQLNRFIAGAKILSFGVQCQLFETNFSLYQGRSETVMVNSGSSANLAIIQALLNLGVIKQGDQVGFSAITWSTNLMPLIQLGLKPIPIDVELDTLNISAAKLAAVLQTHRLKLLFITNLLGFCDDIEQIEQICQQQKIIMIEDNCESLGTVYQGKKLGNYSLASTFSFYVGHHMSTIEGGAVCTDNEDLATMLRVVRAHGWDRNLSEQNQHMMRTKFKVNSSFYSRYTFYDLGYNFRPTEIAGFLGNQQLQYLEEIIHRRSEIFLELAQVLYQHPRYLPLRYSHIDFVSNFAVPLICQTAQQRDELVSTCAGVVEIRPIVGGDMTEQPFFEKYVRLHGLPATDNAKLIHRQGLYFGNNPELTKAELTTLKRVFT